MKTTIKHLHLPLPADVHDALKREAAAQKRPSTALAREAISEWVAMRRRQALAAEIAAYTQRVAGTRDDLDPALEAASIESWLNAERSR